MLLKIKKKKLKNIITNCFFFLVVIYFTFHAINGDRGVLSMVALEKELAIARAELQDVSSERHALQNRVEKFRPNHIDPDLLDEQARKVIGYARPNEEVYFLKQ